MIIFFGGVMSQRNRDQIENEEKDKSLAYPKLEESFIIANQAAISFQQSQIIFKNMIINISSLRCVSQVALLGAVTPNLRGVFLECKSKNIKIFFYYNHSPSDKELELAEIVASEIIADFTECMVDTEKITFPFPKKIPSREGGILYIIDMRMNWKE